jgi:hypothetical protein
MMSMLNPLAQPMPNPSHPVPDPSIKVVYPEISAWLEYCNTHPDRHGEFFAAHAPKFDFEGYRRIHQLTGDRISVEKLSDWLGIGKGTADLLIQYAKEDVDLVRAGKFTMLPAGDNH